jgi:GNAT superfamily N-acetyltransferase
VTGPGAAIAWRHAQQAAVCDRAVPWEHGTAVFATDVPSFWTYNSVRVEGPDAGLETAELAGVADRLQADLAHRYVEVEDEAAGARVRPGFTALGWTTERLVWMALDGPPRGAQAPAAISEIAFARTRPLREAWASDWAGGREQARGFLAVEERVAERRGTRAMAAWGDDGEVIGFASFSVVGTTAEVEQAFVDPARRGGGIGGALVAAAVAAAGAEKSFIVADDEGDPKRLYARLGFAPVWIQHVFTRKPPGTGG